MYYIVGFVLFMLSNYMFSCLQLWCCDVSYDFHARKKIRLDIHFFCKGFMFYLFIYIYWGPIQFHLEQDMLTLPVNSRFLVGVLVAPSLVFCVLFCGSLFVLLRRKIGTLVRLACPAQDEIVLDPSICK
jgi:hypothetical protein